MVRLRQRSRSRSQRHQLAVGIVITHSGDELGGDHQRDHWRHGARSDGRSVEARFGASPERPIEWLTDNGSQYIARDTRSFFSRAIGLGPLTTAIHPHSALKNALASHVQ